MGIVFEVGAALLGACVGSFSNVAIWRLQQEQPSQRSLGGRSRCPHCGAPIAWRHNVPVLGWLWLRGVAACCRRPIALRYPLVELLGAGLFALLAASMTSPVIPTAEGVVVDWAGAAEFVVRAAFLTLLLVLSFIDLDTQLLPDVLTKPGMALGLLAGLWPGVAGAISSDDAVPLAFRTLLASLAGMLVGGGVTWAIRAVGSWTFRREAMGFGDVKLMAMIGAFLGWRGALLTMFLGCVFGAVIGGVGALRGRANVIPFGPFLSLGAVVAAFAGAFILEFLFTTWPEWQRQSAGAPWILLGAALVSGGLLFVLVRRGRRHG